jgi:hypothetical protein
MTTLHRKVFEETLRLLYLRKKEETFFKHPHFICNIIVDAVDTVTKEKFVNWKVVDECREIIKKIFKDDNDESKAVIFNRTQFGSYLEANNARILALHFLLTCPKNFL